MSPKSPAAANDSFSLKPILDAVRKREPKARSDQAQAFAKAFYQRMSDEEYKQHGPDAWAALAGDMLDFARVRKPGSANIRLFNANRKEHGWESPHTVLQVVNDDMPFLVDSVTMALAEQGIGVHVLGHPVVALQRDKAGKLAAIGEGAAESFLHLEIDRQPAATMAQIEKAVAKVLGDVRAIVADWSTMRAKMLAVAEELVTRRMPVSDAGRAEAQEFLRWAANDHFTFLGYREYEVVKQGKDEMLVANEASGLGLLRGKPAGKARALKSLAAHYMPQSGSVDALILTKTNSRGTVHRAG